MRTSNKLAVTLILFLGFLIIGSSIGVCETENTNTLYVSKSGDGNYTFIQDAINASSSGDTIIVNNGTYQENVIINKSINLEGIDAENTVIDGNNNGNVVVISADNVGIYNLTIENSGSGSSFAGINIQADHCIIRDDIVINNSWSGIKTGSQICNCTIRNNIVKNNGYGIFFNEKTTDISIKENTVDCNEWDGIYLDYSNDGNIDNNTIKTSGDDGIGLSYCDNISINNNVIDGSGDNGIYLYSCKTTIIENIISNSVEAGIYLRNSDASDNQFSDNSFSNNNKDIYDERSDGKSTPGFELSLLIFTLMMLILSKRYWHLK